jgi:hypothetical protein
VVFTASAAASLLGNEGLAVGEEGLRELHQRANRSLQTGSVGDPAAGEVDALRKGAVISTEAFDDQPNSLIHAVGVRLRGRAEEGDPMGLALIDFASARFDHGAEFGALVAGDAKEGFGEPE